MKPIVLFVSVVLLGAVLSVCEVHKKRNKLRKNPKYPVIIVNPVVESSIKEYEHSYPQQSHQYSKEVKIPVGKFYIGLPAFLGYLKILFFLNNQCSSATSCTLTATTTTTSTTSSTSTVTSTSTSISVPVATVTSISSFTTTTSTTPVTTTTFTNTVVSSSTQTIVLTSSSTSVTSTTATETSTDVSTGISVTTSTSVTVTTTSTMANNPGGRQFFDYDSEENLLTFMFNNSLMEMTHLPFVELVAKMPMEEIEADDMSYEDADHENSLGDDWLDNEISQESSDREIESSKVLNLEYTPAVTLLLRHDN